MRPVARPRLIVSSICLILRIKGFAGFIPDEIRISRQQFSRKHIPHVVAGIGDILFDVSLGYAGCKYFHPSLFKGTEGSDIASFHIHSLSMLRSIQMVSVVPAHILLALHPLSQQAPDRAHPSV